jgi:hypothetical protein
MAMSSLILQAGGVATSTVGSYYAAKGQKTALKLQARIAEVNAKIAEGQSRDALQRGERQEQGTRMGAAQLRSSQRAAMGSSGIDLGSETAAAVLTSTDYLTAVETNTIKANALREAWGFRMDAGQSRSEASMARATARGISPAGEAFSTLMTGAAQVAGSYASFKQSGALGKKTTTDTAGRSTARNSNTPRHSNTVRSISNFFGTGL